MENFGRLYLYDYLLKGGIKDRSFWRGWRGEAGRYGGEIKIEGHGPLNKEKHRPYRVDGISSLDEKNVSLKITYLYTHDRDTVSIVELIFDLELEAHELIESEKNDHNH